jgi:excisionase family DNA binding protein
MRNTAPQSIDSVRRLAGSPDAISVVEAASLLGISVGLTRSAIRTGQLRAVRVGRRVLVPRQAIADLLRDSRRA